MNSGTSSSLGARERRVQRIQRRRRERARGQRHPDTAPRDSASTSPTESAVERSGPHDPETLAERPHAVEVGIDQLLGLLARQRLDAERARDRDQGPIDAISFERREALRRALTVHVHR